MRRVLQTTAAIVAAVVTYVLVTLPPKQIAVTARLPNTVALGAYHIHTTASDGAGAPEDVAAAAKRAGLSFAILTDHGDATRVPTPPHYVNGVLLIDAVEVSAVEGHIVALGLNGPAPYRLAGDARGIIEDIHRLGGFAIVAHPDSPKPDLRWRPPGPGAGPGRQGGAPNADLIGADGIEWMNADSEWRDESKSRLANTLLHLPVRPAETFVTLFDRPVASMRRWDTATRRRPVIGLSAVDAHGLVAGFYETTFRAFTQAVTLETPLSGDAIRDAAAIIASLRVGRAFSVITGIAGAALPELTLRDDTRVVSFGEQLATPVGRVAIHAAVPAMPTARVVIKHNDRVVAEGVGAADVPGVPEPGAYRMEAWLGDHRIPWIVTNPVYLIGDDAAAPGQSGARPDANPPTPPRVEVSVPLPFGSAWAIEHSPASTGSVAAGATTNDVDWQWQLGTAQPAIEFAALAHPMQDGADTFDRIEFTGRADAPVRLWVQFRMPSTRDERWGRSIYLDSTPRSITVRMSELTPQGFSANRRPNVAKVKALLMVVDTLNTPPGAHGVVHLSNVALKRSELPSGPNGQQQVERPGQEQQVGRPGRQGGRE